MLLAELVQSVNGMSRELNARVVAGDARVRVCDITEDSRTVLPGSLFLAREGTRADGREFAKQALASGAVAVVCRAGSLHSLAAEIEVKGDAALVEADDVELAGALLAERFYGNPASRLKCIGVTGTNGKTTTTWLTWRLLNAAGVRCGLIGTVVVDDGNEVAPAEMTTPPAVELSRTMNVMVENGCEALSMEVSSHSLAQRRVGAIRFGVGVFTNLTQDHLDYHKTMEAYASEKAKLFAGLDPGGLAIVNADDPASERMLRDCRARIVRCTERHASERRGNGWAGVTISSMDRTGMQLDMHGPFGAFRLWVPLIGAFNAMNILQAVLCVHELGMKPAQIMEASARLDAPPGRLERVATRGDEPLVLVDFAHTEDGLRNALGTVKKVLAPGGRLIAVFGCGGDKDRTKRPKMGRVAAEIADLAIVTSDNPRTERPGDIIDQVLSGVGSADRSKMIVEADRRKAIAKALLLARPADIVVIAGKGHETEQIMPDGNGGTVKSHFDDREVAREAIAERRASGRASRSAT
ncbi:MAG: UDP-N-acetylmuramoyl-L-alanyl-D-glutamate--2,6-diaminopimelate ligase [Phycisphaerales bacterium]|nr:UDP-N-acetylmuramoyl-L-alanyl-D-glutamate--2,6-diaminopimelate ligase [Planctomycetota bacterium]